MIKAIKWAIRHDWQIFLGGIAVFIIYGVIMAFSFAMSFLSRYGLSALWMNQEELGADTIQFLSIAIIELLIISGAILCVIAIAILSVGTYYALHEWAGKE